MSRGDSAAPRSDTKVEPAGVLEPFLHEGETLVWAGRPSLKRFGGEIAGEFAFGMILAAVGSIVFIIFTYTSIRHKGPGAIGVAMVSIVSLVFMFAGAWGMTAPKRYRRLLAETVYGITDERAIMANGFGYSRRANISTLSKPNRSFPPEMVEARELKRKRRDGSGDVVFDSYLQKARKGGDYRVEIGFFGVENVEEVDRLLGEIETVAKKPVHEDMED